MIDMGWLIITCGQAQDSHTLQDGDGDGEAEER